MNCYNNLNPRQKICLQTIIFIANILIFYKVISDNFNEADIILIILSFILLLLSLFLFYLEVREAETEKTKLGENLSFENSYKQQINYLRSKHHDLKNQLSVIKDMLGNSQLINNNGVLDFTSITENQINEMSILLKLNNRIIGMLLFNKYRQARDKGVEIKIKSYIADIPYERQAQYDFAAILGNLLDNAIDATKEGGEIILELGEENKSIYISTINSGDLLNCDINTLCSAGYTTKGEDRGYGLSNVRSMVMKHGGNMELMVSDGKVEFRVYLPISA